MVLELEHSFYSVSLSLSLLHTHTHTHTPFSAWKAECLSELELFQQVRMTTSRYR